MDTPKLNLDAQLAIQKLKEIMNKEFDSEVSQYFPDTLNFQGVLELQKIRCLQKISFALISIAQLEKEVQS